MTQENFTRIPNELIEKLARYRISGEENLVLWAIIRKTYGWGKDKDKISFSQFSKITELKRQTVSRAINKLLSKNVIKKDDTYIREYSVNEHYEKWETVIKKDTSVIKNDDRVSSKKIMGVIKNDDKTVINIEAYKRNKDTITKDTITKEISEVETSQGNEINNLIELFKNVNVTYESLFKNKTERSVLERFIKKWGYEKTDNGIKWAIENQDEFTAITKPTEFERNVNKIILKKKTNKNNNLIQKI